MRRLRTNIIIAAATLTALAACTGDLADAWRQGDGAEVVIRASKGGAAADTRTSPLEDDNTTFSVGDKISVAADGQDAVTYTLGEDGTWTPNNDGKLLWRGLSMDFSAYYPAEGKVSTSATEFNVPQDQSTEANLATADWMTFVGSAERGSEGEVNLKFERKMARVTVKIADFTGGFTENPTIDKFYIRSSCYCPPRSGDKNIVSVVPFLQNGTADNKGQKGSSYTALVAPGSSTTDIIELTTSSGDFCTASLPITLEAGKSYVYDLTVQQPKSKADAAEHIAEVSEAGGLTAGVVRTALGSGSELKVTGTVNGDDLKLINTCTQQNGGSTRVTITKLDLSEATLENNEIPASSLYAAQIAEVVLPTSCKSIGNWAFRGSSLTTINLENVTSIGTYSFAWTNVTDVDLRNVETVGEDAFMYCTSLTTANLSSATTIGEGAFSLCSNLTSVTLTNVTSIGAQAFQETAIKEFCAPKLTKLDTYVLYKCTLTLIDLPECTELGNNAFGNVTMTSGIINLPKCTKMGSVVFGSNTKLSGATMYLTASGTISLESSNPYTFYGSSYTLPNLVLNPDKASGGSGSPTYTVKDGKFYWGDKNSYGNSITWPSITTSSTGWSGN